MMSMASFASMSFDEARDSLHRDAMATMPMLESLSRTASAPTLRTSFGPSAFLVPGHPSAALLGPGLTEAELQTLILNESEPQWQPAAAHDIKYAGQGYSLTSVASQNRCSHSSQGADAKGMQKPART